MRGVVAVMFGLCLTLVSCAHKNAGEGVPVRVYVLDSQTKEPIPTAVVRHPEEAERHRVNESSGYWEDTVLYLPKARELVFQPGMTIQLEVSAPAYMTKEIMYDIKRRRNHFDVYLDKIDEDTEDFDDPIIQFGRDKPAAGGAAGPAN